MNLEILRVVWEGQDSPFVSIPKRTWKGTDSTWREGSLIDKHSALATLKDEDYTDFYWCPHTFKDLNLGRIKENVTDSLNFLWGDLDKVKPAGLKLEPSIAWQSSNGSYQALWLLDKAYDKKTVEGINKDYNYYIGADKSGWDLTQLLRIPDTSNYKYNPPHKGEVLWFKPDLRHSLESFKVVKRTTSSIADKLVLPKRAKELIQAESTDGEDRSERLWELEKLLIEANVPLLHVVEIVKDTVWNKFKERPKGDVQLLNEVVKAEAEFKTSKKTEETSSINLDLTECDSFKDFMYKDLAMPEFMVKGVWQDKSVGIMAGEPKTMKSMMAIDMGLSVATGTGFLGSFATNQGAVLYIQEEINTADVKNRVFKMSEAKGITNTHRNFIPDLNFHVINNVGFDITTREHRVVIEHQIEKLNIKLLILDPMYMMLGDKDENSATELRPVLQWLTSLRERYECSVLLIHHFKKSDSKRVGQRMRGSSILHAWVECGLYLEIHKAVGSVKMFREFRSFKSDGSIVATFDGVDDTYNMDVSEETNGSGGCKI